MKKIKNLKAIESISGIVAILQFGSYGTDDWIEGRSDIDFLVLMAPRFEYEETLDIEDDLETLLMDYYDYDDIHISFVLYKDYGSKYARILTDSDQTFIIDDKNWFDFQHYVFKYARINNNFEQRLIEDEKYTYFGRDVDDALL
ncbi:MAG: nucleotidyltransferase domain-containing protein [Tissierellales bacterium]|jgi:predicted nucleotidyltransferase|nr:nucleotidyltransferase domain-containing protein [Tissierellales bacterium]